jgi:hypothetical protein
MGGRHEGIGMGFREVVRQEGGRGIGLVEAAVGFEFPCEALILSAH